MKKNNLTITAIILFVFLLTGCSSLFGPSLKGNTHTAKALDGAKQIEKSDEADEELIQLFNEEYILAYEETRTLIDEGKSDVSKFLDLHYATMHDLATRYTAIRNKYGSLINSEVDYVELVENLDKTASEMLFDTGMSLDRTTEDTKLIDTYIKYISKAYDIDETLKEEGMKTINEYLILAGDIKSKSTNVDDLSSAIFYYNRVLNSDKDNSEALAKLNKAIEKQNDIKISSIHELLESENGYAASYKAEKVFNSLNEELKKEHSELGALIEQKRTAMVLFCVNDSDDIALPQTKVFKPNWTMNELETSPKKIVVDYMSISNEYFDVPEKYNYVFIPDSNFGQVDYDYDTEVSDDITVNSTSDKTEQALYEISLKQNPDDDEAKKALETGTYRQTITTVSRTINDVYNIYKVNNGIKEKITSTSKSVKKNELEEIEYISGSKDAIFIQTGASFEKSNYWGDKFNYSDIENYFSSISIKSLYNGYFNNMESYFYLLK